MTEDRDEQRRQVTAERARTDEAVTVANELRTELATTSAQLAAAREQIEAEQRHAAERIADLRERAEHAEAALDALRHEQTGREERTKRGTSK